MSEHAEEVQQDSPALSETRLSEIQRKLNYYWLNAGDSRIRATLAHHAPKDISDLLAEVRRLQGELASAREETAQAVRVEREAIARFIEEDELLIDIRLVPPDQTKREYGRTILRHLASLIRSRSHPGETADA